ncbi:hypothetical protein Cs7R123_75490 [Catellatospora sp. TT07R-123]|uniref:hypothetical protein n=1 Tax=Catellatospora sp. TT07R-123 TaxID=2733863 RepID=UPI001B195B44|nr:hypothetical protein [Catellatospora sp. TT07R-123]GHJ50207.1 hypothetical protein Cs7R123_75490 [Catellatospora sp. TT07R-123]
MDNEDEYGRRLLQPLAGEPPVPSRIDLSQVVAAGRRRRRTRHAVGTTGLLAVAMAAVMAVPVVIHRASADQAAAPGASRSGTASAAASPSQAASRYDRGDAPPLPTACKATELPSPGGGHSYARAVDPSGHYVAYRTYINGTNARIWHDGQVVDVPMPGEDNGFEAVNASGVAVGVTFVGESPGVTAMVYRDGGVAKLPGADGAAPSGVNAAGVVVGEKGGNPVVWRSLTSRPEPLPLPKGFTQGSANDVDDDGMIVGHVSKGGDRTAYVWSASGKGRALPAPVLGGVTATDTDARKITNGWVTGYATFPGKQVNSVRWDLATGKVVSLPKLTWSNDVSRYGWVTGMSTKNQAVLTDGTRYLVLEEIFPRYPEYGMNFGESISDDGLVIVGQNDDGGHDGLQRALVWHCS